MKKRELLLVIICIAIMFGSCSTSRHQHKAFNFKNLDMQERRLQSKSNWAIRKASKESDTLYLYGVTFNDWEILWYHKNEFIHSCIIYPNRIKWQNPVVANNIIVNSDSIKKTFVTSMFKDVLCFETVLDGEFVCMVVDEEVLFSSIKLQCLFAHEFPAGSFAYKLQYDLSKVLMINDSITQCPTPSHIAR